MTGSGTLLGDDNHVVEGSMGEDITKAGSDVDKPGINPEEVPGPTEEAAGTGAGSGKTGAGPGTEVGAGSCTNGALKGSGTELGDKTMWKKKRLREKTPSALGLESAIKKSLCLL